MSVAEWFPLVNESAKVVAAQSESNALFIAYAVLCAIIKRPVFLLAFFMSCALFDLAIFDSLKESELYAITFAIYSYVIFKCKTNKSVIACAIILILSIILGYDAYFYGVGGSYGEAQTVIYSSIKHLSVLSHIIFICSLIPYKRIQLYLRDIISSFMRVSVDSAYMLIICYNKDKQARI